MIFRFQNRETQISTSGEPMKLPPLLVKSLKLFKCSRLDYIARCVVAPVLGKPIVKL